VSGGAAHSPTAKFIPVGLQQKPTLPTSYCYLSLSGFEFHDLITHFLHSPSNINLIESGQSYYKT